MKTKRFYFILIGAAVVLAGVLIYLGIKSPEAQAEQSGPESFSASEIAKIQHQRALDVARSQAFSEKSSASLSAEQLIQKSRAADAARWTAMANALSPQALLAKSRAAETARLTAMAKAYLSQPSLAKSQAAEAARWSALAEYYANK